MKFKNYEDDYEDFRRFDKNGLAINCGAYLHQETNDIVIITFSDYDNMHSIDKVEKIYKHYEENDCVVLDDVFLDDVLLNVYISKLIKLNIAVYEE